MARKKEDQWMPTRVYKNKSSYYYKPTSGVCITLCRLSSTKAEVWQAYERKIKEMVNDYSSVNHWFNEFLESGDWADLSLSTRKDYTRCSRKILPVFGKMDVTKVQPMHIRAYMDKRGAQSRTRSNRELSLLQKFFGWLYERGKVSKNPAHGIKRYKEKARTRYINDDEFKLLLDNLPPMLAIAAELSYLLAARKGDLIKLQWSQVTTEGIFIEQSKTGKRQIKTYSPRLRAVIAKAKLLGANKRDVVGIQNTVLINAHGGKYTDNSFGSAWQTAVKSIREKTGMPLDFTFHDIKAKSVSDYEGDKQEFSGHKTAQQVEVYNRKDSLVPSLGAERTDQTSSKKF